MTEKPETVLLKQLSSMIEDETAIVTYKTLSRRCDLPVNQAKQLLAHYLSTQRKKFSGTLSVLYSLIGTVTLEDGSVEDQILVIPEDAVPEWERKLRHAEKHVYSIQATPIEDSASIRMADNPVDHEGIRSILSTTAIQSPHVTWRGNQSIKRSSAAINSSAPGLSMNGLKKLETEAGKVMEKIGVSVEALRVKPTSSDAPAVKEMKEEKSKPGTWIKSGGINRRKSSPVKSLFESRQKEASKSAGGTLKTDGNDENGKEESASKKEEPTPNLVEKVGERKKSTTVSNFFAAAAKKDISKQGSASEIPQKEVKKETVPKKAEKTADLDSDDDDTFTKKKSKGSAVKKAMLDSDNEETADDDVLMEQPDDEVVGSGVDASSERHGTPSGDEEEDEAPVGIRRKSGKTVEIAGDYDEAESSHLPKRKKKSTNFHALTNVSSDEEEEAEEPAPTRRSTTTARGGQMKRSLHSDNEEQPNSVKAKGKWGFGVENEEDEDEEEPKLATPKRKPANKRATKSTTADDEAEDDEAAKPKRSRKKAKREDGSDGEERQPTPSPQPMRQFLAPIVPVAAATSGKQRKQVLRTSVDADGYEVTETVWVEVDAADAEAESAGEKDGTATKATPAGAVKTQGPAAKSTGTAAGSKGAKKATTTTAGKGKGAQSSIMNFFKKI